MASPAQRPFAPLTEARGTYKPSAGWVGGSVWFDEHTRHTAPYGSPDASAHLEAVGSTFDGRVHLTLRESWNDSAGRSQERVISVTLTRENARALFAAIRPAIAPQAL